MIQFFQQDLCSNPSRGTKKIDVVLQVLDIWVKQSLSPVPSLPPSLALVLSLRFHRFRKLGIIDHSTSAGNATFSSAVKCRAFRAVRGY